MPDGEADNWRLRVYWTDGSDTEFRFTGGKPERSAVADGVQWRAQDGALEVHLVPQHVRAVRLEELAGD